ncbi:MAG: ABC transporter permease subunit [Lachnospiraceae bacterium]|nr:ABC transporter permease subunit [Lachnospiraceae bacterium]
MWNIIKSQWYQLIRDKRVRGTFIVTLLFNGAITFANTDSFGGDMQGGPVTADLGSFYGVMGLLFMLALIAFVMGTDFVDKTLNYEILSGHSRKEVLFGRFIVAALAGSIGAIVVMIFFPCVLTVVFGWGSVLEPVGVFRRYVLVYVMLLRIACELAFISVIVKNPYVIICAGYIVGCVQLLMFLLKPVLLNLELLFQILSVCRCFELLNFPVHMNEVGRIVGTSVVELQEVLITIAGAVIIGTAAVVAAYAYFRRDDLH